MAQPRKFDPSSTLVKGLALDALRGSLPRTRQVAAGGRVLAANVTQNPDEGSGAGSGLYRNRFQFMDFNGEVVNGTYVKGGSGIVFSGEANSPAKVETHPFANAASLMLG